MKKDAPGCGELRSIVTPFSSAGVPNCTPEYASQTTLNSSSNLSGPDSVFVDMKHDGTTNKCTQGTSQMETRDLAVNPGW